MDLRIEHASVSDDARLQQMLNESPMRLAGLELTYDRSPKFSQLLEYQAKQFDTVMGIADDNLVGFASYSWGTRLNFGKKLNAVYIGDFRVKFMRAAARFWRSFYPKLIEDFLTKEPYGPASLIYTAILKENTVALANLVKNRKSNAFYYHHLKDLVMVNVLGQKPFTKKTKSLLKVFSDTDVPEKALREFLVRANANLFLGYDFSETKDSEWERRKLVWPDYGAKQFITICKNDEIIGCSMPWSPSEAKRMRVTRLNFGLKILTKTLSLFGFTMPKLNEAMQVLYLTHLYFKPGLSLDHRAECVAEILDSVMQSKRNQGYQFISFADANQLATRPALNSYLTQKTEVSVFTVSLNEKAPEVPSDVEISFEMALV